MIKLVKKTREYIVEGVVGNFTAEAVVVALMEETRTKNEMTKWKFKATRIGNSNKFKVLAWRRY